jgi:hypothetical protein
VFGNSLPLFVLQSDFKIFAVSKYYKMTNLELQTLLKEYPNDTRQSQSPAKTRPFFCGVDMKTCK